MKKKIVVSIGIVLLAMLVGVLVIVHKSKIDIAVSSEKIKLPILISGGDASWEACMEEVAAEYMQQHPEVEIEIRTAHLLEGADYNDSLLVEEAIGNFDGIVEMRNASLYAKEGKIVPMPEELSSLMNEVTEVEGKVYSLPRFSTCRGIIYNKKIFAEYGIDEPKTYQEFLVICDKLKENGVSPLVVGAADKWHLKNWINALFYKDIKAKYPDWITLRNKGKVHWSDPEPKKMVSEFKDLFQRGYVEEDYQTTTDAQTIQVLTEGKAGMLYSGTWMFSQILKADQEFELGWFFLPDETGTPIIEMINNVEWSITSSCAENKKMYEEAVKFLKLYYSSEIYKKVLQSMSAIPTLKKEVTYESIPIQQKILEEVREYGKTEGSNLDSIQTPEGFINDMCEIMYSLVIQDGSIQQAVKNLDKEWDEDLEKTN